MEPTTTAFVTGAIVGAVLATPIVLVVLSALRVGADEDERMARLEKPGAVAQRVRGIGVERSAEGEMIRFDKVRIENPIPYEDWRRGLKRAAE